ncbi:MAG: TIGR02444 family protein, partial [Pseudomonadales bacterium]|nr:TIGR02444 family protein [Pseudomonadales bacterium]
MSEFVVTSSSFWNFSLQLYEQPGVPDACLQLQNDYGLDVNLVLFCLWYGKERGVAPQSLIQQAIAYSLEWKRGIVQPLRDLRTSMKGNKQLSSEFKNGEFEELRSQVKSLELQAEKMQQLRLEEIADAENETGSGQSSTPHQDNLRLLCEEITLTADAT